MQPTAFKVQIGKQPTRPSCAVGGYVQNMTKEIHLVGAMYSDVAGITYW